MINRFLILISLFFAAFAGYSQQKQSAADSLAHLLTLSVHEDTNKVKLLLEYNRIFFPTDLDSSLKICRQVLTISDKINFSFGIIKGINAMAACYWFQNKPDLAIPAFHKALEKAVEVNNNDLETMVLSNLGIYYGVLGVSDSAEKYQTMAVNSAKILTDKSRYAQAVSDLATVQFNKGDYITAIQNTLEAQKIYEAKNMNTFLANSYIKLGMIYFDLNDFDNSVNSYQTALNINKQLGDIKLEMAVFLNMGLLYFQVKEDHDSALIFLTKALQMAEENKVEDTRLMALVNLGSIAFAQKNASQALEYYNLAFQSPLIPHRNQQRAALLVNMGGVYLDQGDLAKAEEFTKSGLQLAEEQKFVTYEKIACKNLGDIEAKKGNYKAAFEYNVRYSLLQDTLGNQAVKHKVADAVFRKELEHKENENLLLQKNNEIKQKTILIQGFYIITASGILLLVILLLLVNKRNSRRQQAMNLLLDLKNKELHELNLTKDKFFSIISHDLRGPFNGFLGLSELMADELPDLSQEEIQKIAINMRDSAANLFRLLENLLEWSRMQQGNTMFNPESVMLMPLVNETLLPVLDMAHRKGIEISHEIPAHLGVSADRYMLASIIRNLTSNAVKYTFKGGKVNITAKLVPGNFVEIAIKDTGIGMSAKRVGNLFRLDVQNNRRGTDNEPSSGLGLLLCKDFIEKHGGSIWVGSEEGKGSTFYFTIPYNAESQNQQHEPQDKFMPHITPQAAEFLPEEMKPLKILIAEDDVISDSLISVIVKKYSREIIHTKTGDEAAKACQNNTDIDLILIEINLPDRSGYEAIRRIRQFNKDVIIIAQSFANVGDRQMAIDSGSNNYIEKPIVKEELVSLLRKYFNQV
jgi:signal transduction histidine kinase/CheY-like chemotaxis protein/Flp pilus assembly protein TadD